MLATPRCIHYAYVFERLALLGPVCLQALITPSTYDVGYQVDRIFVMIKGPRFSSSAGMYASLSRRRNTHPTQTSLLAMGKAAELSHKHCTMQD
jgi:hypothetical protein